MNAMHQSLQPELGDRPATMTVRAHSRRQYMQRLSHSSSRAPLEDIEWRPDDVLHGENLHGREQHIRVSLRWTGPGQSTHFVMYLGSTSVWKLNIRLHPATPRAHAEQATLRVNDIQIPLCPGQADDGYALIGLLSHKVIVLCSHEVARFELLTPVVMGQSEFRMLGVALARISLPLHYCMGVNINKFKQCRTVF